VVAAARTVAAGPAVRAGSGLAEPAIVDRLAAWLLGAVALDLVLTRFVVRLAMFIPKGEPWATASAAVGRVGAAVDALVPIVGLLLLAALLVRAGRFGSRAERAVLVGIGVVAAGGLALVVVPPTPGVVLGLDVLVALIAAAAGIRLIGGPGLPRLASAGVAALAAAVALAACARAVGAVVGGPAGLAVDALGQLAFVLGAAVTGLAGVASVRWSGFARRRLAVAGVAAGILVLAAGDRAPLMWGALAIWSVGLAGAVPTVPVALALGLAVAGLPILHRWAPPAAVGASIVLLAGYGLAASGLVLAGLLGLVVAGMPTRSAQRGRST
jgi:hypothetical protein